jgi:beta-lactam-binding protein with PASTA domain
VKVIKAKALATVEVQSFSKAADAEQWARNKGMVYVPQKTYCDKSNPASTPAEDTLISTSPGVGASMKAGDTLTVILSKGPVACVPPP